MRLMDAADGERVHLDVVGYLGIGTGATFSCFIKRPFIKRPFVGQEQDAGALALGVVVRLAPAGQLLAGMRNY